MNPIEIFWNPIKPERGEIVLTTTMYYPPDLVEAWKNALEKKLRMCGEHLAWQYVDGRFAELRTNGDPENVLDEIKYGNLDIATFAKRFQTQQT